MALERQQQYRVEWVSLLTGEVGHGDWFNSKETVIEYVEIYNDLWKGIAHHTYVPRWYGGISPMELC
jgi:hypothetical protein